MQVDFDTGNTAVIQFQDWCMAFITKNGLY